jgi:hypothetical protein
MDGNGGNTVCNPNYQVSNNFEPATRWARSNNVYALPSFAVILPALCCTTRPR